MADLDRRVRRTRRMLQEALVALIEERGYDRLTVQEVLDRADVGRSTFYAHFRDKDALFMSCFDDLRDDLRGELDALAAGHIEPTAGRPVAVIFAHADRNRRVYRAVCGRQGSTAFTDRLQRLLYDLLHEHLRAAGTRVPVEVVAEFHAGALLAVLLWWIRQDFPGEVAEVAEMCRQLTEPGVQAMVTPHHHGDQDPVARQAPGA